MKIKLLFFSLFLMFSGIAQEDSKLELLEIVGKKIDSTLNEGDATYMNNIYDLEELSKRFLIAPETDKIKKFNKGFLKGFSEKFKFGDVMLGHIDKGSRYDYLRSFIDKEGNYIIQFRLYGDGLNYHNHIVEFFNEEPKIVDSYIFVSGENISETFKTMYTGLVLQQNFKNLASIKDAFSDIKGLILIRNLKKEAKFAEAKEAYETLSDVAKSKKIFKLMNVMISKNLSEEIYKEAINDFEKQFPNDASLNLISIDGYIMSKEYDKAMQSINNLDKAINGDDFLDYLRGNIYYLQSNSAKAEELFLKTIEKYDDFIDPLDSLLALYIEQKRNTKVIEVLDKMVNDFFLPKELISELVKENYAEFSETQEFKNWINKK